MGPERVEIIPKLVPVFEPPRGALRYRGAYGGRGSGKSMTFALMAALWGYREPLRILATREFIGTIKESFHAELRSAMSTRPWLEAFYDVKEYSIRGKNGTEFIFRGLRHNIQSIRSLARIDLCIVEEAEDVPEQSWRGLIPTIRAPGSEIWAIWNPHRENSPVDTRFRKNPDPKMAFMEVNYSDNPWFPEVLEDERQRDQRVLDSSTYAHIWDGAYLTNSNSQILANKIVVREFEPEAHWSGPYHGLDWGFSQDPTVATKSWVFEDRLWVEYEAGKTGLELDDTGAYMIERIPRIEDHVIRADNSRPESISQVKRGGPGRKRLPKLVGVKKWAGSVEDGIAHLRAYKEIVVHPRCTGTIREGRLYSYKTDRLTGDVLPDIIDAHNHYIDSIRYGIEPLVKRKRKRTGVWGHE